VTQKCGGAMCGQAPASGPREPAARSMARLTAGRGRDPRQILVPLPPHRRHPVAVLFAEVGSPRGSLEDPQKAQKAEQGKQRRSRKS